MAEFEKQYKKSWAPNRAYNYYTKEWYDSEMEANAMGFLKLLGSFDFHCQGLVFIVPFLLHGRYKPDAWYSVQPNGMKTIGTAKKPLVLLEIKGWYDGEENELKRRFMQSLVDDPGDEVVGAYWQMTDKLHILGYDGKSKEWEPAALYVCPYCGKPFYAVKTRDACPYCGQEDTRRVTDEVNGAWGKWWKKVVKKTQEEASNLTAQNKRFDIKDVWDKVIADEEKKVRKALRSRDGIELSKAEPSLHLEKIDWKSLVRDSYSTEGKENKND